MYVLLTASKWKDSNHISALFEKFTPSYFILLLKKVWCRVYTRVLLKKASEFGVAQEIFSSNVVAETRHAHRCELWSLYTYGPHIFCYWICIVLYWAKCPLRIPRTFCFKDRWGCWLHLLPVCLVADCLHQDLLWACQGEIGGCALNMFMESLNSVIKLFWKVLQPCCRYLTTVCQLLYHLWRLLRMMWPWVLFQCWSFPQDSR